MGLPGLGTELCHYSQDPHGGMWKEHAAMSLKGEEKRF